MNVLAFLAMVFNGVSAWNPITQQLVDWGALYGPLTLNQQWWRLLTSMFLHIGFIHLALNMWCLWNLGLLAESLLGRWTYLASYLATGVGAGLLSLAIKPNQVSAGASGAVFGLAGVLITGLHFAKLAVPRTALQGTIRSVGLFAFYNLIIGFSIPAINNTAHLGGLVTGLMIGLAMAPVLSRPRDQRGTAKLAIMTVVFLLLLGGFMVVRRAYQHVEQDIAGGGCNYDPRNSSVGTKIPCRPYRDSDSLILTSPSTDVPGFNNSAPCRGFAKLNPRISA
jgi:rhomboid protease GluP